MLHIKNLNTKYGPIHVLKNVSLHVDQGEIVSIIGANGAGKTTLLLSISGLINPVSGDIFFEDTRLNGTSPSKIVSMGVAHAPEGRQVFSPLTVLENLRLGAYARKDASGTEIQDDIEKVYDLFPRLRERRDQTAGTLSGGEQQMLAIGRAMMAKPRLLLLDEPSLGLAPKLVEVIMKTVVDLNNEGTTVLLVEQNARKALEISHRAYVLETGRVTLQGPARELAEDSEIRRAYLGKDYKDLSER
ncbi:MAG: branched-chain amino acid ABC transporter ATP-binding protein [Thermodesulfatator sp.]|nr:MAG: branched-chain amino acid ABC transporter ATP-binding protein [Thermodesulfatator sp.]